MIALFFGVSITVVRLGEMVKRAKVHETKKSRLYTIDFMMISPSYSDSLKIPRLPQRNSASLMLGAIET